MKLVERTNKNVGWSGNTQSGRPTHPSPKAHTSNLAGLTHPNTCFMDSCSVIGAVRWPSSPSVSGWATSASMDARDSLPGLRSGRRADAGDRHRSSAAAMGRRGCSAGPAPARAGQQAPAAPEGAVLEMPKRKKKSRTTLFSGGGAGDREAGQFGLADSIGGPQLEFGPDLVEVDPGGDRYRDKAILPNLDFGTFGLSIFDPFFCPTSVDFLWQPISRFTHGWFGPY